MIALESAAVAHSLRGFSFDTFLQSQHIKTKSGAANAFHDLMFMMSRNIVTASQNVAYGPIRVTQSSALFIG